jgi:hypothetical protein
LRDEEKAISAAASHAEIKKHAVLHFCFGANVSRL